jgi:hypothetical protein
MTDLNMFLSLLDMSSNITYDMEEVELTLEDDTCVDTTCVYVHGYGRDFRVYFDNYNESII